MLSIYNSKDHRWRDAYNPLRGLGMPKLVSLQEAGERGQYADLQWMYYYMERSDPMIYSVLQRRRAALLAVDWDVREVSEGDKVLAGEQADFLREAYDQIDNLRGMPDNTSIVERARRYVQHHSATLCDVPVNVYRGRTGIVGTAGRSPHVLPVSTVPLLASPGHAAKVYQKSIIHGATQSRPRSTSVPAASATTRSTAATPAWHSRMARDPYRF